MDYILALLIVSLLLNFVLGTILIVRTIITKQATNELLERVTKLEEFAKRPPEKITIISKNKETAK